MAGITIFVDTLMLVHNARKDQAALQEGTVAVALNLLPSIPEREENGIAGAGSEDAAAGSSNSVPTTSGSGAAPTEPRGARVGGDSGFLSCTHPKRDLKVSSGEFTLRDLL